jgi:predicted nucleic acid-binding protein
VAAKKRAKKKPTAFILDASIALAWFFEDEADAYAEAVRDSMTKAVALVPALWYLEIGNALLVAERKGRTSESRVTRFLTLLTSLPIRPDHETAARAWTDTLGLARKHRLSTYDAAYLELALREGLPLATLDEPLRDALRAVGGILYLTA